LPDLRPLIKLLMPRGNPATIPAKMISEIPLPIPLSDICSPNHMIKVVPVVKVSMVNSLKPQPGLGTILAPVGLVKFSRKMEIPKA